MNYILGLDLGVASVGWALVPTDPSEISVGSVKMGVRIFEAGVDGTDVDFAKGKEASRNMTRRTYRGSRRNIERRRRRCVKLFNILQRSGLLPQKECHTPLERQRFLNWLDLQLLREYFSRGPEWMEQRFIYHLRAKALDEQLLPEALGRIFYSLVQRRGFLSNKKAQEKENDKELGKVKQGIAELNREMEEAGARTLGEFYAGLDSSAEGGKIRGRWVGRQSYKDEFEAIWTSQRRFYPELLTNELKDKIFKAIFYQRPLKSQKFLVGKCDLEPKKRRTAKANPLFQEFRYWQRILDMTVYDPGQNDDELLPLMTVCYPERQEGVRRLTQHEQDILADLLENSEKVTFTAMRKALGFKLSKKDEKEHPNWYKFNFELKDGDKDIKGNVTRARIRKAFRETRAPEPNEETIDLIAKQILFYDSDAALKMYLMKLYPEMSEETADVLSEVRLEPDYGSLSHKALTKLLPLMKEKRIPFATARKELYGEEEKRKITDLLDPVEKALGNLRNPTVTRTLTEMRKVVNNIIKRYGRPEYIRVELARDLKRGRKERETIFKNNKERENERKKAEQKLVEILGNGFEPKPRDVLKYRLYQECGGYDPYTGERIELTNLFGPNPRFDIEHIIPFSRSLDDSFANKTLCKAEENREVKKNRTPYECYAHTDKWANILLRVSNFKGPLRDRKLSLFKARDVDNAAPTRLLNDSRYISKVARQYLDQLYGAVNGNDSEGIKRVQAVLGDTTAWLRDAWNLNVLLLPEDERRIADVASPTREDLEKKNRADHRHHALDALVIALTDAGMVKRMSECASLFYNVKKRVAFARWNVKTPVEGFRDIVKAVLDRIIVSRRIDRKVSGPLHEQTNYGREVKENGKTYRVIRNAVYSMSKGDIEKIIDKEVQRLVQKKLSEVGGDPKKLVNNLPYFVDQKGRKIPIRSVRYRKANIVKGIGKTGHERFVELGSNHHVEVYAVLDEQGKEKKWKAVLVSMFEAYRRVKDKEPVVQRDFGPNTKFKFSLGKGEAFTMNDDNYYIVRGISTEERGYITLKCKLHTDARTQKELDGQNGLSHKAGTFQKKGVRKIEIDILGEGYSFAND